ncbi:hypothetical protein AUJ40_02015 [Candidatus Berkelbacteria bacterium CG1_02_42_45]|uniref:Cation-transporting P-type ATPase N-terminal domain-containing protein n=1 Tax=Candidatus Berkelbacteria bacterium CG1_02_42_45 TaxID=1805036 RepID=A0A1J4RSW1_9BACT|nr:MAG: hypothetical protein AUJ40_02015 [Candidatus Berkelbacteria bacterium CG1_02_42_45]
MNSHKYDGLSEAEALKRREKFGENVLREKKGPSPFYIFISQFKSPLIYVLLFAAIISFLFQEYSDFGLITAVIALNAIMGFYQEYNAQKTLSALKKILKPIASVIRQGKRTEIEVKDLVPGDIVVLAAGDQIPADGKTHEATNLLVNEAILTGEEEAVDKKPAENAPLFMGTTVISGVGIMEVTKIGLETEIGKISEKLSEIREEETPLQIKLQKFSTNLIYIIAVLCLLIFILGITREHNVWTMFRFAMVLAVAAIPEGLPIAATVILARGMKRILKRKGLVKKLLSVETLGSTSVICTDKTGTLTRGIMQVVKSQFSDAEHAHLALILANQQKDNLEVALWQYVEKHNHLQPKKLLDSVEKIYEEPFNSENKYSLSAIRQDGTERAYVLGAPEVVLGFCKISESDKEKVLKLMKSWAELGLKIVGCAYKKEGDLKEKKDWIWLGILGIEDPIRPEVKEAISACQNAGIKIKIVTGDFRETAIKVAKTLGLKSDNKSIMEAPELERISPDELKKRIENITIFPRITPHQKLKIVEALQGNNEVVAMTGDGVNDALALKKADIAVVVANASDVAKEVSDLILLDSNFKTIVAACEEGRVILANIKKVVSYALSNSFVELILIFGAVLLNFPTPLTVAMILWINLICDGPIDIVLGFEDKEKGLMEIPPRELQRENILDKYVIITTLVVSFTVGTLALISFWYYLAQTGNLEFARTIAFAIVISVSLIYVFAFKNLKKLMIKSENFFANKYLLIGIVYGIILILAAVYLPYLNKILGTVPIAPAFWFLVLAVGIVVIFWVEILKSIRQK